MCKQVETIESDRESYFFYDYRPGFASGRDMFRSEHYQNRQVEYDILSF